MVDTRTNQPASVTATGAGRTSPWNRAAGAVRSIRTRRGLGAVVGMLAVVLASGAVAMSTSGGARSGGASAPRPSASAAVRVVDAGANGQDDKMIRAATATAKNVSPPVVVAVLPTPVATTAATMQAAAAPTPTPPPTTQAALPAPPPPAATPPADP